MEVSFDDLNVSLYVQKHDKVKRTTVQLTPGHRKHLIAQMRTTNPHPILANIPDGAYVMYI